jgi:GrpB-like predicted nucleotidyltransferase (UPF0157 family)/predicted nucleotidyltransferase
MGSDEALRRRQDEVEAVAQQLAKWASVRADVRALAMIGSWARGEGRLDSDLDILLLTDVPSRFTASTEWLSAFGSPPLVRREQFGLISERRVRLDSGLDVEFGIGPPQWASTTPIDAGTRRVAQQGLRSLFDPDGLLASLRNMLLGDEDEPIRIVSYEPSWTARFEQEKADLQQAIGPWVTGGIHHVGSTAVPGMAAKPVIDILVGVESLPASRACFEPLAKLRYGYAPYRSEEMHWFCKPSPSHRTHHLHLVPRGSKRYRDELAFRDALRARPATAKAYLKVKRALASSHEHDREAYTVGKAAFIADVLKHAS